MNRQGGTSLFSFYQWFGGSQGIQAMAQHPDKQTDIATYKLNQALAQHPRQTDGYRNL